MLQLEAKPTWLHRVNPSVKLLSMLILFIVIIFIHHLDLLMNISFLFLLLLFLFSGHPFKRVSLLSIPFLLVFISTSTSMIFFGKGDTTWFKWGLVHITEESFFRGIHLGFRALSFAALGLLFVLTTKPVYLFYSLMQQLRVPPRFAYSFMAAIRLIPIMYEEFQTLRYAYQVRGMQRKKGLSRFYQTLTFYTIPLLAQSIRRAQRMAVAMETKRFSNRKRTYYYQLRVTGNDLVLLGVFALGMAGAWWLSHTFPYFDIQDVRYYE